MTKRAIPFGALLLLVAWFAGCSLFKGSAKGVHEPAAEYFETYRSAIQEIISDPDKAANLLIIADDLDKQMLALDALTRRHYERIAALDADYEATPEEFQRAFDDFNRNRGKLREEMLEQRFLMIEVTTPEEWDVLSDLDTTLLESWQRDPNTP